MFTGIIEGLGKVIDIQQEEENFHITIASPISNELKIDQSLAHNGVCLTVVAMSEGQHTVTAIKETMEKSNFQHLKVGDSVNLERAMMANARLDGHMVQGHVDKTGICTGVVESGGSWYFHFSYDGDEHIVVDKGSICINGVSLTVVEAQEGSFSVAIIPYTYEHTNFHRFETGTEVNLEFDIIGKYITQLFQKYVPQN